MAVKKTETKKAAPKKTTAAAKKEPIALPTMDQFPSLKKGTKETGYVTLLQTNLKNRGYYDGPVDGKYGDKTEAAVKEFQKDLGKPISGTVGPKTWDQLKTSTISRVKAPEPAPAPPPKPNVKVVIEGLSRYQAELLVKLFSENMECYILQ